MSCIKCGYLYCVCDALGRNDRKTLEDSLNGTEQALLMMWNSFVEHELGSYEKAPRIVLEFFRKTNVSTALIELMARAAREYGHEV